MYDFLTIISCKDGTIKDLAGKTDWEIIGDQDRIYADMTNGKFGNGCLHLEDTTDKYNYLYPPHTYMQSTRDDIWCLEDKDFTVSLWVKLNGVLWSINSLIHMSGSKSSSNGISLTVNYYNTIYRCALDWGIGDGSRWVYNYYTSADNKVSWFDKSSMPFSWVHVAMVRKGTRLLIFIDGIKTAEANIGVYSLVNTRTNLLIGSSYVNGGAYSMMLDDLEIIKGYAMWDSDFNVPTKPLYEYIGGDKRRLLFNLKVEN